MVDTNDNKDQKSSFKKLKKVVSSVAIAAMLLPNVMNIGAAQAQEENADEPQVEETETTPDVEDSKDVNTTTNGDNSDMPMEDETADNDNTPGEEAGEEPEEPEETVPEPTEDVGEEEGADTNDEAPEEDDTPSPSVQSSGDVSEEPGSEEPVEAQTTSDDSNTIAPAQVQETYTVTIDPNGGTMNPEYETMEVDQGENYILPYGFESDLAREGYTLTGYTVEGTLLDADGNEVTDIPRFRRDYTPQSDVTLTANWEVTSGGFRVRLVDDSPATQPDRYNLTLTSLEDGQEYTLTSNSYGPSYRTWEVDDVPNGTYTLAVNGFNILEGEKSGHPDTDSTFTVNDDGTATVDLDFEDDSSTTFIRYEVQGEQIPEIETYPLNVEVRGLDGTRTTDVGVTVTNEEGEFFTGSYNEWGQWLTDEELPEGSYTITLDTPTNTVAEINDTVAAQSAVATDQDNVFTIDVNEETQGSLSAVYGAFTLVEDTYPLAVEVRGLDGTRTSDVGVEVTNEDGEVFEGSYGEYTRWFTNEELPPGEYTITLDTPEGTVAVTNDTAGSQHAVPTDEENVFTIMVNEDNLDNLNAVYGAFSLVEDTYPLGVEVRGLDGTRTTNTGVTVTNEDGDTFTGSYNEWSQWLTDEELPEGSYTITLDTPTNTVAEINDTVSTQSAVATDEDNVFTIDVNEETQGNLSSVYGAFILVEDTYPIGVEVRGLDGRRTSDVGVEVTNEDGEVFEGSYGEYTRWFTDEELPVGEYIITLDTPEGTVAVTNDTAGSQHAVPTDEENVFTITVSEDNLDNLQAVYAAFNLVEEDDGSIPLVPIEDIATPIESDDDDDKSIPLVPIEDIATPIESDEKDDKDKEDKEDKDDKEEKQLPKTGSVSSSLLLTAGAISLLSGLGVMKGQKNKKDD